MRKTLTTPKKIEAWLRKMKIQNYTINPDLSVDVKGNVNLNLKKMDYFPVNFNEVNGYFACEKCGLLSLEGAPRKLDLYLNCSNNRLTSLDFSPIEVKSFFCSNNQLTSLSGAPKQIEYSLDCSHNALTSLLGAPEHLESNFYCSNNCLVNLEHGPKTVGHNYYCDNNSINTLEFLPSEVGADITLYDNLVGDVQESRALGDFQKIQQTLLAIKHEKSSLAASLSKTEIPLKSKSVNHKI